MNRSTVRIVHALLAALLLMTVFAIPSFAQEREPAAEPVSIQLEDGRTLEGRRIVADDFIIVCPELEVLDQGHPCSETTARTFQVGQFDDLVVVCPVKDVLDDKHPCFGRTSQIRNPDINDLVVVCPAEEVLNKEHGCSEENSSRIQRQPSTDYVLVCPPLKILDTGHPCSEG